MSWKKFLSYNSAPSIINYPELPEHVSWFRLILGFLYGLSLGVRESYKVVKIRGAAGIIFGLNLVTFLPMMYLNSYLKANTNSYNNLTFAGVPNGMAMMLLVWIIFFTMVHEDEELAMVNFMKQNVFPSHTINDVEIQNEIEF